MRADGVDLLLFRDYGFPNSDLEIEYIDRAGMKLHLRELVDSLSVHLPGLKALVDRPQDQDRGDLKLKTKGPALNLFLGQNEDGSAVDIDWLPGQPPLATFYVPFSHTVSDAEFRQRSERLLLRHGLQLHSLNEVNDAGYHHWCVVTVYPNDQPVCYINECATLLTLAAHSRVWPDQPSPEEVLQVIRLGHVEMLSGWLVENEWFDAKERVDLGDAQGKLEFAKDLAQFANAPRGGILLIGARTDVDEGGTETFSKICALDENPHISQPIPRLAQQLRAAALMYIYPAIEGLRIEIVRTSKGQVIYAHVPKQSNQMKPFIVIGEVLSGKMKRNFFSIPVRTHDGNVPVTPHEIHSLLAGKMSRWQNTSESEG